MKGFLLIIILNLAIGAGCSSTSPKATANGNTTQNYSGKNQAGPSTYNTASGNTASAPALSNQPPDAVLFSFKQRYPDLTANDWAVREEKYCTTYVRDGISYSAFFTPAGEWIGTETDIALSDLPALVKKVYENGLYGKTANPRVLRIENNKHPILYRVEGLLNNQPFVQYFTPEGQEVQAMAK